MSPNAVDPQPAARAGLLRLVVAGLIVGALAGLLGAAFHYALDAAIRLRGTWIAAAVGQSSFGWLMPVALTAAAAALARYLVRRFAPEAAGSGVQHVEAVVRGDAVSITPAVLPVKFAGGVLAIGSGFALGREGPTVQMGATTAHLIARLFSLDARDSRALLAAGSGAGLAAAFNAPLAGAIFVFEELISGFDRRVGVATLAACSAGLAVMHATIGDRLVFTMPPVEVDLFPGYLMFLGFGAVMGLVGMAYNWLVVSGLVAMDALKGIPSELKAAAVGAIVGWLAWYAPVAVGGGESQVQAILDGGQTMSVLLLFFVVRFFLGPLSYSPGLPGGLFAPLLVVGALAGTLFGSGMIELMPHTTTPAAAFAAVGMGALFVGVVRAPLTGIAIVIEITGAGGIFIPLLAACAGAVALPTALGSEPIYDLLRARDAAKRRAASAA